MRYFLLFTTIMLVTACSKIFGDLGESARVEGIAVKTNPYALTSDSTPLASAVIKIRYVGSFNSYLYTDTTDASGRFSFTNLKTDTDYEIFYEGPTDIIPYVGYLTVNTSSGNNTKLVIAPDSTKINIMIVKVIDQYSSPVNSVKLYRFTNKTYFDNNYTTGAIDSVVTDSRGICTYYKSTPGKYYFLVSVQINSILLSGRKELDVPQNGVTRTAIVIQ